MSDVYMQGDQVCITVGKYRDYYGVVERWVGMKGNLYVVAIPIGDKTKIVALYGSEMRHLNVYSMEGEG